LSCEQEDESIIASRSPSVAVKPVDLCAAVAVEFDEDECEVEDFVPVEIPPPMDEIQTHTLPTQQHSVSCLYNAKVCLCDELWVYVVGHDDMLNCTQMKDMFHLP